VAEEDDDIHNGRRHLRSVKTRIADLKDGKRAVEFLEHLEAKGLHTLHAFVGEGFIHLTGT
jgi:hypothetical protein